MTDMNPGSDHGFLQRAESRVDEKSGPVDGERGRGKRRVVRQMGKRIDGRMTMTVESGIGNVWTVREESGDCGSFSGPKNGSMDQIQVNCHRNSACCELVEQ